MITFLLIVILSIIALKLLFGTLGAIIEIILDILLFPFRLISLLLFGENEEEEEEYAKPKKKKKRKKHNY